MSAVQTPRLEGCAFMSRNYSSESTYRVYCSQGDNTPPIQLGHGFDIDKCDTPTIPVNSPPPLTNNCGPKDYKPTNGCKFYMSDYTEEGGYVARNYAGQEIPLGNKFVIEECGPLPLR